MEVTNVQVKLYNGASTKIKGFATIVIDGAIAIHNIRIINGEKGLFLSMPTVKDKEGKFQDIVHPINADARAALTDVILEEYDKQVAAAANAASE